MKDRGEPRNFNPTHHNRPSKGPKLRAALSSLAIKELVVAEVDPYERQKAKNKRRELRATHCSKAPQPPAITGERWAKALRRIACDFYPGEPDDLRVAWKRAALIRGARTALRKLSHRERWKRLRVVAMMLVQQAQGPTLHR